MRSYIWTLIFIHTLALNTAFSHQDFWVIRDYKNVKVRISTGFEYEEINKVLLFAQLAERLAQELNYSQQLFLDFNHHYTGNCDPDYFISYDKGNIEYTWKEISKKKNFLKGNAIVVRQVAKRFDALITLKLLEYAIMNSKSIQSNQTLMEYNKNYCQWKINSIDTVVVNDLLKTHQSDLLKNVMNQRVERPDKEFKYGVSYYLQNSEYTIFLREYGKPDIDLITFANVCDFRRNEDASAIIFDSDSSFYCVDSYNKPQVSARHVILNANKYYVPIRIKSIGGDRLSFYFWYYSEEEGLQPRERMLLYLKKKDELIQDLDRLINQR